MNGIMEKIWNTPILLLIFSVFFWAGNSIAGKFLSVTVPPITISLIRLVISCLLFLPFALPFLKRDWSMAKQHYMLIIWLTVTGVVGFNLLSYLALQYTTVINFSLFNCASTPVFIILLAFILIGEKWTASLLWSILLSIVGIAWLITDGSLGNLLALRFNIGDLITLSAAFLWALYSIWIKKSAGMFHDVSLFGYCLVVGVIMLFPLSLVETHFYPIGHLGPAEWTGLVYLGVFPSICAFMMWNRAVVLVGPSQTSVYKNLTPVFSTLFAFLLLNEQITSSHITAGALIVMSLILAHKRKRISVKGEATVSG